MLVSVCVAYAPVLVTCIFIGSPLELRVRYRRLVQLMAKPRKLSSFGLLVLGSVTTNWVSSSANVAFVARSFFFGDGGSGEMALGVGSYQMIGSSGGLTISPEVDARIWCVDVVANCSISGFGLVQPTTPFRCSFGLGGEDIVAAQRLVMLFRALFGEVIWVVVASSSISFPPRRRLGANTGAGWVRRRSMFAIIRLTLVIDLE